MFGIIGLVLIVAAGDRDAATQLLRERGETPINLGHVESGSPAVRYLCLQ